MIRLVNKGITLVALLVALWGCYEPPIEKAFVTLPEPTLPNIGVDLADSTGKIYVYDVVELVFTYEGTMLGHGEVEVLIDNTPIFSFPSSRIIIDPKLFSSGTHVLKVRASFTLTGTGSIAAQLGREQKMVEKAFDLVIDLVPPSPVTISQFSLVDGQLIIRWNQPAKSNFLQYKVRRFIKNQYGDWYEDYYPVTISKNATQFRDSSVVGGTVQYRVDMLGYTFEANGVPRDTTLKSLEINWEQQGINSVRVFWDRPPLYGAINYLYFQSAGTPQTYTPEAHDFLYDIPFGKYHYYSITVSPKYGYSQPFIPIAPYSGQEIIYEGFGETIQKGPRVFGNKEIIIYGASANSQWGTSDKFILYEVNTATRTIEQRVDHSALLVNASSIQRIQAQYTKTPDGQYLYLFAGNTAYQFGQGLQLIKSIDLSAVIQSMYSFAFSITAANNGLATFHVYPGKVVLMNLLTEEIVYDGLQGQPYSIALSSDGNYFSESGKIYQVTNSTLTTLIPALPDAIYIDEILFKEGSSSEVILGYGDKVTLFNIPGNSISGTFIAPPRQVARIMFDPVTGRYGGSTPGVYDAKSYFYVFDINSNTLLKEIWFNEPIVDFRNSELVSLSGFRSPL